jgi:pyruvate dehydrogenase E2 component (dihydrolipoamide acetyltransferase)
MSAFRMPSLGADMEAGTLVEWLKRPGDAVHRGDVVAVVETQKGAIEVEIFEDGVIEQLLVEPGRTVPVGTTLALVRAGGTAAAAPSAPPPTQPTAPPPALLATPAPAALPPSQGERPRASPAARRLAASHGVALAGLRGSGPEGAIVSGDVEAAVATPAKPRHRGLDLAEMRRAIAAAMARSKREIPHYYLASTIDLTKALAFLATANDELPPAARIIPAALLLKATALALREFPALNGFYNEAGFAPSATIHIGVAVALRGGGLVAPALHDTDRLALAELMERLRDLVARARNGQLRGSELVDPTVTVTSLGERGVETVFGVIYPPQVALIGFGTPVERPWVVDGAIGVRRVLSASLAADHRASDGHQGALFLLALDRKLQEPEKL